jgi:hypothetical protein
MPIVHCDVCSLEDRVAVILSIASVRGLQGYYFSKPLAAHEVGDKLRAGHPEVQIQAQAQSG